MVRLGKLMMKHAFCRTLAALLALAGSGYAHGQIYKCTSPTGSVEYTDVNRGKQCKAMDLPDPAMPVISTSSRFMPCCLWFWLWGQPQPWC